MEALNAVHCEWCFAVETPSTPLRFCAGCGLLAYCCRDHQKNDWKKHKVFCASVKKLREAVATEERKLHDVPRDAISFAEAKRLLAFKVLTMRALAPLLTRRSIERVLADALDCLRLDRSDQLRVREAVPSLLLQLGQVQECYDFLKWHGPRAGPSASAWYDPTTPFRAVKDADMTESIGIFHGQCSVFFWGAMTFIKMTLANMLEGTIQARTHANLTFRKDDILTKLLMPTGFGSVDDRSLEDLHKLHTKMAQQATDAFRLTNACNNNYWKAMLDPAAYDNESSSCQCTQHCRYEMTSWLANNAAIWAPWHDFIHAKCALVE